VVSAKIAAHLCPMSVRARPTKLTFMLLRCWVQPTWFLLAMSSSPSNCLGSRFSMSYLDMQRTPMPRLGSEVAPSTGGRMSGRLRPNVDRSMAASLVFCDFYCAGLPA
jgi:hypothetical protein